MRGFRIVALFGVVGVAVFAACAPLLSFDDLSEAPKSDAGGTAEAAHDGGLGADARPGDDGGVDAAAIGVDAGDLCARVTAPSDAWYCERVLDMSSSNPSRLWTCLDGGSTGVTNCAFGCFQAPPGRPDLCAFCNLGDGDYCPSEFSDVYVTYPAHDVFVIHCSGGQPLPKPSACDGGARCVRAAPGSHCP